MGIAFYKSTDKKWFCILGAYNVDEAFIMLKDLVAEGIDRDRILLVETSEKLMLAHY